MLWSQLLNLVQFIWCSNVLFGCQDLGYKVKYSGQSLTGRWRLCFRQKPFMGIGFIQPNGQTVEEVTVRAAIHHLPMGCTLRGFEHIVWFRWCWIVQLIHGLWLVYRLLIESLCSSEWLIDHWLPGTPYTVICLFWWRCELNCFEIHEWLYTVFIIKRN